MAATSTALQSPYHIHPRAVTSDAVTLLDTGDLYGKGHNTGLPRPCNLPPAVTANALPTSGSLPAPGRRLTGDQAPATKNFLAHFSSRSGWAPTIDIHDVRSIWLSLIEETVASTPRLRLAAACAGTSAPGGGLIIRRPPLSF